MFNHDCVPSEKLDLLADVTTALVFNILFVSTTMAITYMRSKGEKFRFRCVSQVRVGVINKIME